MGELVKVFTHFSVVAGLDVALFDPSGRELAAKRREGSICAASGNGAACRKYLSGGGLMAAELGEPYIFYCGCGLVMCLAPVMFNEDLAGIIACGPAALWEVDEVAVAELGRRIAGMDIAASPEGVLGNTPSYGCAEMSSAAQLFFIMVNSLTREHSRYLRERARITSQQAEIAALLTEKKPPPGEGRNAASAYPVETEKELISFVQSGNKPRAVFILNNLLSEIFSLSDGNMDTIRVKIFELIAFLSRSAFDAGAPLEELREITRSSFEVCSGEADFERVCFLTTQALERFIDTVYQHRRRSPVSGHLSRALEYIALHYGEELSLGSVAEEVYVSKYYLSHLFRKELNTTFSGYVCKLRLGKAKELLKNDPLAQIQEIAEKAGFSDSNYFTIIFKKSTGLTPKEYHALFR
jgi:two-component system response regulator YesN